MSNKTITFIGAGNMATSLIGGLITDGFDPNSIWATAPHNTRLDILKNNYSINTTNDNKKGAQEADVIILAVKPQVVSVVATELNPVVQEKKPLVLTIAAGIRENDLQRWLGGDVAIVRCMPNTPALVRSGATGLYANQFVSDEQKNQAESIMRAVGLTIWIDEESNMDIVTALSGSGPAYYFLVMEALEQAAQKLGLSQEAAHLLTIQSALGAGRMALEREENLEELRRQVTSPGGTTEAAMEVLEAGNVRQVFFEAVKAAKIRSEECANILGGKS